VSLCFRLIAVEFAGSHKRSMNRKPANMGIAGVEPHQLAPTVGMTGSGSMDLSAPSSTTANLTASTRFNGQSSAMAVDSASSFDIDPHTINFDTNYKIDTNSIINTAIGIAVLAISDTNDKIDGNSIINTVVGIAVPAIIDTNDKIDVDSAINTAVSIAVPAIININPPKTKVDIAGSTVINTASPSTTDFSLAVIIIDPISGTAGAVSVVTGGFDMAFGLFNFHVDNDGVAELISVSDLTPPAVATSTSPVIEGNPSTTLPLAPSKEEPRLEISTPSVGSNDFKDPPPSPTTAYCVDCDAYHYVGTGDFSSHEIAGCEDPRGGTAAVYPTISECEQALNALTLRTTPYDPDYVKGLYSDYTCSDDNDVYPEAKGKIGNSANSFEQICHIKQWIHGRL
jgi:hypothetical protein